MVPHHIYLWGEGMKNFILAVLLLITPMAYASDMSEGEVSATQIEAEEAQHEQAEALRLQAEEENEIAELQAEARREEEQSRVEALAAEEKARHDTSGKDASTVSPQYAGGSQ